MGLGMGLCYSKHVPDLKHVIKPLYLLLFLLAFPDMRKILGMISAVLSTFHDFLVWDEMQNKSLSSSNAIVATISSILALFFIAFLCWETMLLFGGHLGRLFEKAPSPIKAYSWDIAGSALGIIVFTLLSLLSAPAFLWILLLSLVLISFPQIRSLANVTLIATVVIIQGYYTYFSKSIITNSVWTPYQKIEYWQTNNNKNEWYITTNNAGYQQIQDNRQDLIAADRSSLNEITLPVIHQYSIPAMLLKRDDKAPSQQRLLVVGAGSGNDVAGLLRHTQGQIDAVEIDPQLVKIGTLLHPEHPYQSTRVNFIIDDARAAFVKLPKKTYDLIVFGLLDSHTTPTISNARLDNFVYTKESLHFAKQLLSENGVMVILFAAMRDYVRERIDNTLRSVFEEESLVFNIPSTPWGWGGQAFINGHMSVVQDVLNKNEKLKDFISVNTITPATESRKQIVPTTDNWPYLYIMEPSIPVLFYVLGSVLILLWLSTRWFLLRKIKEVNEGNKFLISKEDLLFFFLGSGFSTAQVFAINKASILFGSTWIVNSSAILGILCLIMIANFICIYLTQNNKARFVPDWVAGFTLSLLCIGLAILPFHFLLNYSFNLRFLGAGLLSGLPMLISGIIFGRCFNASSDTGRALGANLLGAMVGGILQLATFRFGINSLMILSASSYFLAAMNLVAKKEVRT
jgi:tRNA1(Val) A37 N6-methylase TrmN6